MLALGGQAENADEAMIKGDQIQAYWDTEELFKTTS